MELPFVLKERGDGSLVYGIASWYRALSVLILAVLLAALLVPGEPPTVVGWILLALAALGVLYEERWRFGSDGAVHKVGAVFAARRVVLPVKELSGLRVVPYVAGTVPGSEEESRENARALSGDAGPRAVGKRPFSWRKPYLLLILEAKDGSVYAIDRVPARRRAAIRAVARRIAGVVGLPLED